MNRLTRNDWFLCRLAGSVLFWLALASTSLLASEPAPARHRLALTGDWQFRREQATEWKPVQVPSTFQSHEGNDFHGVGWYRKEVGVMQVPAGQRVLVEFRAAATEAEVWWDGQRLGTHLGGWTPFRFDITEFVRRQPGGQRHELKVRLDEKVGHNTQGFLPIIAPHFGGLWQEVSLLLVPEDYLDDLRLLAVGEWPGRTLRLEAPIASGSAASITNVSLRCRLLGEAQWHDLPPSISSTGALLRVRAPVPFARAWSPMEPNLYEIELALPGPEGDRLLTRAAFRAIEAFGPQFRLNGQPLQIRGVLNWGYSPPRLEPNPGEAAWRAELAMARGRGFNLMKFCLWVPPQRYLELADELGMLTWMEYPTWHPRLTGEHLAALEGEFKEFFTYDRNHPSVVLRSLTCETGPSAELRVIQRLYDTAHELIPGALVEDDSSWIGWNRVHDFYDDHPYGNNHTWVKTLDEFKQHVLGHGLKPLVLGEAIAADTWVDRPALLARLGPERPWWAPASLDDMASWLERMRAQAGPGGLEALEAESKHYGLLMRKYQAEAFRREVPYGGYVISVIRDEPKAAMGLIDFLDRPKWSETDWQWQGDTMLLLQTDQDRRSYSAGGPLRAELRLSHFGSASLTNAQLEVTLHQGAAAGRPLHHLTLTNLAQPPGTLASLASLDWPLPQTPVPVPFVVEARLSCAAGQVRNQWPFWLVPSPAPPARRQVQVHASLDAALAKELFPDCPRWDGRKSKGIVAAARFDDDLVRFLEGGGRVLFLPDGRRHSLPLKAHWFLSGAPYIPEPGLGRQVPRQLLLELQHFDLAADVVPNLAHLEAFDPLLMLWDTHDQATVKTHGILFETQVGRGRLLVSAARHTGPTNAVGRWLLEVLLHRLRSGAPPTHTLPPDVWAYAKAQLHADPLLLVDRPWKFQPDPKAEGLAQGWAAPKLEGEADWKEIRIGSWWESQGYPALDGWAWYRLHVPIPKTWQGRDVYLSFEGVDDVYEIYVNGQPAGKGGDLATRASAFNERKSHNITRWVTPGNEAVLAVRVYDWFGAGGIFRPVALSTQPLNPSLDWLK